MVLGELGHNPISDILPHPPPPKPCLLINSGIIEVILSLLLFGKAVGVNSLSLDWGMTHQFLLANRK